jgi:hypothetical protein
MQVAICIDGVSAHAREAGDPGIWFFNSGEPLFGRNAVDVLKQEVVVDTGL